MAFGSGTQRNGVATTGGGGMPGTFHLSRRQFWGHESERKNDPIERKISLACALLRFEKAAQHVCVWLCVLWWTPLFDTLLGGGEMWRESIEKKRERRRRWRESVMQLWCSVMSVGGLVGANKRKRDTTPPSCSTSREGIV